MATSRPKSTELSEFTSFSVTPIEGDSANTRVTVTYKNPADLNRKPDEPPMLFKFNISGQEPVEKPMVYSEERKQWELSLDVSNNVRGFFEINGRPPQVLNLELKDGAPYPWIYKDRSVAQGTLTRCLYKADGSISPLVSDTKDTILGIGDRLITVYLPPGYDPERKPPYNLQITLDGDDLYAAIPTNVTLDNLIAAKKIDPVVAVFIPPWHGPPDLERYPTGEVGPPGYSQDMRIKEYACNSKVAESLVALPTTLLREGFNVTQNPEQTAITGISISGVQALYTALSYPDVYGNVIAQSSALQWGPNLLLMSELPPPDKKYMQVSIITPDGLYQLNENKTEYARILDSSEMKKLGFERLIADGLEKGNVSFYHALSLAQFRDLNHALKEKGAKFDIHGDANSALLPNMISEGGHFAKPDEEKPLKVWLQSGIKDQMLGELQIAEQTEITAELLRQQKYAVAGEVIHQGGHQYTHWRCGLPDALVAMHQPAKVSEAKLTFDELQVQAALVSKSKRDTEAPSSLDSPVPKSEVNASGSIQDKAKEKDKNPASNPDGSTTRPRGLS